MHIASMLSLTANEVRKLKVYDQYSLHIIIHELFSEDDNRSFLFRDMGLKDGVRQVLILSDKEPKTPRIGALETKTIPEGFYNQKEYSFQTFVNPVKFEKSSGKRRAVIKEEDIRSWFVEKAERSGFKVSPQDIQIDHTGLVEFVKPGGNKVSLNSAIIKGHLTVLDQSQFKETATKGFGRGKAFGFGLMQVVPVG